MENKNTPFGGMIEFIDAHLKLIEEQEPTNFKTGYIKGALFTRNICSSFIPEEKQIIKEIFEAGQENKEMNFEQWFKDNFDYKEYEELSLEIESKKENPESEMMERLIGDNSSELVNTIAKPKRYFVFFIFMIVHFLIYTLFTAFYLITLQFKKISRLPASAEETKNYFKDKLGL